MTHARILSYHRSFLTGRTCQRQDIPPPLTSLYTFNFSIEFPRSHLRKMGILNLRRAPRLPESHSRSLSVRYYPQDGLRNPDNNHYICSCPWADKSQPSRASSKDGRRSCEIRMTYPLSMNSCSLSVRWSIMTISLSHLLLPSWYRINETDVASLHVHVVDAIKNDHWGFKRCGTMIFPLPYFMFSACMDECAHLRFHYQFYYHSLQHRD